MATPTKHWLIVLALIAAVSALALVLCWDALITKPGVTPENFARLHENMSLGQMEAILGPSERFRLNGHEFTNIRAWHGDDCEVVVGFDEYGAEFGWMRREGRRSVDLAEEPTLPLDAVLDWLRTIGW